MGNQNDSFLDEILEKVDDFFAEEIGPVAAILCAESKDYWSSKLQQQNKQPGLRSIHIYVNHLATSIEDQQAKQRFIDNVYSLGALNMLKKEF